MFSWFREAYRHTLIAWITHRHLSIQTRIKRSLSVLWGSRNWRWTGKETVEPTILVQQWDRSDRDLRANEESHEQSEQPYLREKPFFTDDWYKGDCNILLLSVLLVARKRPSPFLAWKSSPVDRDPNRRGRERDFGPCTIEHWGRQPRISLIIVWLVSARSDPGLVQSQISVLIWSFQYRLVHVRF